MKDLITSIASILIISLFITQYVINIKTFSCILDVESSIREISFEGVKIFDNSSEIEKCLKDNVDCKDISVSKVKNGKGFDEYEVKVDIPNAVALLGKGNFEENNFTYKTTCVIKKEENEESDNNDRVDSNNDTS